MNFKKTNIQFKQKYDTGEFLRVGDIIRVVDASDENMNITIYGVYTWIEELNGYFWLNEYELFDYSTLNFEKYPELMDKFLYDLFCCGVITAAESLEKVSYIGNISDPKFRDKLDQGLLLSYIHLFKV